MPTADNATILKDRLLLQALGGAINDALVIIDDSGNLIYFNSIAETLLAIDSAAVPSAFATLVFVDEQGQLDKVKGMLNSMLAKGDTWRRCLARSLGGRVFPAEVRVISCQDLSSESWMILIRDRTDQIANEQIRVRKAEILDALNLVLTDSRDGLIILDEDGFIRMLSPGAEKVVGNCLGQILDKYWLKELGWKHRAGVSEVEWENFPIAKSLRGEISKDEFFIPGKDSVSGIHINLICRPILSKSGECHGAVAVLHDITELRQKEQMLFHAQKVDSLGRLAGGVAHDFNNLLAVILGFSEMALHKIEPDSPLRLGLDQIRSAGEKASHLTRQLLAFSRKQKLELKISDLNKVLSDTGKMMRRLIPRDIEILTVSANEPAWAVFDRAQLESAIINLVLNAKDAMPDGGKLTLKVGHSRPGDMERPPVPALMTPNQVYLEVSDTGTGMTSEVRQHLFEPFFTTKPQGQGTGLGLATVFGIVNQSGGHIDVETGIGAGTVFRIYFPEALPLESDKKFGNEDVSQGCGRVLLVEDDPMVMGMVREQLVSCGYEVVEVVSGSEALKYLDTDSYRVDLLLTDVVMPRMSGDELADLVRMRYPKIKIVFMSGYTDGKIGQLDYLQKPFTLIELSNKLREVLAS